MEKLRLLGVARAFLNILSLNARAAVVKADWKIAGYNLLTHDEFTGLSWLDLTETNGLSRYYVLTQLDA